MYQSLLTWHFKGETECREIKLFKELRRLDKIEESSGGGGGGGCDKANNSLGNEINVLSGVCLGSVVPSEIMFQYHNNKPGGGNEEDSPVCAAVTSLHQVHFGNFLLELATLFYLLPVPLVRSCYMVFMLQNYCHVLTLTLEMLCIDWQAKFNRMSFQSVITLFFKQLPQAIVAAVVISMQQTDAHELASLIHNRPYNPASSGGGNQPRFANRYIPLTSSRIEFLIRLMGAVPKPV